ncbi:TonB-dependent siderophore receptor [Thauera linaloolentis 47Lol = DSM 12138]|uniref:TonB-dependent siderophore receptor n=2 Tax=Thauera linaloolentis TaxID=76112 RepID=N6ZE92_THAL4|nr:TonB-dependent siderophore receptor [Thauera linaloolentis 47Lol = DSM 12138]
MALATGYGTHAAAQTTGQAPSSPQTYDIPAGPLAQALARFAASAGVSVQADARLVEGLRTTGLSGTHSAASGLAGLLAGSGLEAVERANGTYVLRVAPRPAPGEDTRLAPVTVSAAADRSGTTEGSGSYTSGAMNTATPLSLSMRETPQSVSVVTRDRIEDGGMTTVEDALAYTTGLTILATAGERSTYSARGFGVTNIMVDGLALGHDSDTLGSASLAMYDRMEVVRGATGLLEGSGNPSASINLLRKRPTDTLQASVSASVGRWDNYLGTLDIGGPLNEAGSLRARAVVSLQDSDTFTKDYSHERRLFYGILEADLSDRTLLTLGAYHNTEDNPGADWNGLPTRSDGSFYDFKRSVRASPSWSYWNKENTNVFGELKHSFANDWSVSLKGSYLDSKLDMLGTSLIARSAADTFTYNVGKYDYHHKQTSVDLRASGPFALFGREHQLAIGANYRRKDYDDGPGGWPNAGSYNYSFDPSNWQNTIDPPGPGIDYVWSRDVEEVEYGAYATAKFSLGDPLNLFVGGRLSWFELEQTIKSGTFLGNTAYDASSEFTPYLALSYDVDHHHTVYGSVTGIFNPQNYASTSGSLLDPVEGTNYELGIKGEYLQGRLNASAALFQINQENLPESLPATSCPTLPSCYAAAGEVRSRGIELELSGNLTDNWRAFAGYTYQQAEYVEDSMNGNSGDDFSTNIPHRLLTLSTLYKLPGRFQNWRIGASARIQSKTKRTIAGYATVRQSGYGIVNLMAGYSPTKNLDFQLNINNVFDKEYYRSVGYPDNASLFGEPRNFVLTAKYSF